MFKKFLCHDNNNFETWDEHDMIAAVSCHVTTLHFRQARTVQSSPSIHPSDFLVFLFLFLMSGDKGRQILTHEEVFGSTLSKLRLLLPSPSDHLFHGFVFRLSDRPSPLSLLRHHFHQCHLVRQE